MDEPPPQTRALLGAFLRSARSQFARLSFVIRFLNLCLKGHPFGFDADFTFIQRPLSDSRSRDSAIERGVRSLNAPKSMESRPKRVLSCDQRGLSCTGNSYALCSRYQPQNAGREPARGRSALDAICAYCPPSHDLVSSAAISLETAEGPRPLSQTSPVCEMEMPLTPGAAASPHLAAA